MTGAAVVGGGTAKRDEATFLTDSDIDEHRWGYSKTKEVMESEVRSFPSQSPVSIK
jgi:hypothetical protein